MAYANKLYNSMSGQISGAQDLITWYHGLRQGSDPVTPDKVELKFTNLLLQAGGGAPSTYSRTMNPGGLVPVAGTNVTLGNATRTEVYTFRATATLPFEVTIGATVAATLANLAAEINRRTYFNLFADVNAGLLRLRGTVVPGVLSLAPGLRDWSSNAVTWAGASWNVAAGGAGTVSGTPEWTVIYMDNRKLRIQVRGVKAGTTLDFTIIAERVHPIQKQEVTVPVTGVDGAVNLAASQVIFNSAGANFVTSSVRPWRDQLVIHDPTNPANNGVYDISAVTAHTLTVVSTKTFNETRAGLTFSVNSGLVVETLEPGGPGQVPYDLPSSDSHSAAGAATDVELPGQAISPAELDFDPVMANGEYSTFAAHFTIGAFPQGQTIQIAVGDTWTGAAASNPAAREFLSGAGAAADLASFVAAVNDPLSPSVANAINGPGDVAILIAKTAAQALTGVSSHANCVIGSQNALVASADKTLFEGNYVVGADDPGFLAAGDEIVIGEVTGTAPRLKNVFLVTAAGGIGPVNTLVVTLRQYAATNRYALCLADAGAVLGVGDVLEWEVIG